MVIEELLFAEFHVILALRHRTLFVHTAWLSFCCAAWHRGSLASFAMAVVNSSVVLVW